MPDPAGHVLKGIVGDQRAEHDLRRYFARSVGGRGFTGGRFESLCGGGDRETAKNRIVADDLIAVSTLSVQVPPEIALDILEGDLGNELSALLAAIPVNLDLGVAGARDHVGRDSPAELAWGVLKGCDGVGWVIAGKVLARKRPRLIPVYDTVVRCVCHRPDNFWLWLHDRLADEELGLRESLLDLRARAEVPPEVSDLRVLDVAMWMRHRNDHVIRRCAGVSLGTAIATGDDVED